MPSFLNVFVDGDDIRLLGGLDTAVTPATTILLLPAVAGGLFPATVRKVPNAAPSSIISPMADTRCVPFRPSPARKWPSRTHPVIPVRPT